MQGSAALAVGPQADSIVTMAPVKLLGRPLALVWNTTSIISDAKVANNIKKEYHQQFFVCARAVVGTDLDRHIPY
jgi:hypothetical protein